MSASDATIPVRSGEDAAAWVQAASRPSLPAAVTRTVRQIIERVRSGGDGALLDLAEQLDGGRPRTLSVSSDRCRKALDGIGNDRRMALETACDNLRSFHGSQRQGEEPVDVTPGVRAWREFRPIDRIGVYAPGGRAAYPSSVLMSVVPARVAGVREIAVCCPAGPAGEPPDSVLAACALLGVEEVYAVGGAQAIAAMALGTETVPRVDKIFGPGGAWVNAAKLALFGEVGIDLPAGPSEVTVWADGTAKPDWIAAELVAQAEHGPDSVVAAVLSDDRSGPTVLQGLARAVAERVALRAAELVDLPREAARESLRQGSVLVASTDAVGAEWVNDLAPEHLSIQRTDAAGVVERVRHAGSVFVGEYAPVAAGDYCSGTNHVLPTSGRSRSASGLSVSDFGRWIQVQTIDREGLEKLAPSIETLAAWEGLPAHAASVRARFEDGSRDGRRPE
jgi:histidinol dehydrogenase